MKYILAHIINPVARGVSVDLDVAQPITFATLLQAKDFATGRVHVEIFSAQYTEDREVVPEGLLLTPDLQRSSSTEFDLQPPRKLPLIRDIFSRLHDAAPTADYLLYSNVDIAVKPEFYVEVNRLIDRGYDAFAINRRNIPGHYTHPSEISDMLREEGTEHPGHDCFVIKREIFEKFRMVDSILGIGLCFRPILLNCLVFAENFLEVTDHFLTFHIGEDEKWQQSKWNAYTAHNEEQIRRQVAQLDEGKGIPDHPLLWKFLGPYMKPDALPKESLQAELKLCGFSIVREPSDFLYLNVRVRNRSTQSWSPSWRSHLQLGFKWIGPDNRSKNQAEGRAPFHHRLEPGAEIIIEIMVPLADAALPSKLEVDMVQDGFRWFSSEKSSSLKLRICKNWRGRLRVKTVASPLE